MHRASRQLSCGSQWFLQRLMSCANLALACALTLFAASAHASHMATIVRGQGAGSDKAAALVGHYLRDAMSRDERYEVMDLLRVLGNQDRDHALHTFQVAEEMIEKGHEAYDRLDLDAAESILKTTLQKYEKQAAYVADFKKVAEALLLLGAVHSLKGEEKLSTQSLEQAINVYPQTEPDPRIFNPAMRNQFQQTANKLAGRPTGVLTLSSSPGYAEVYVDGHFMGVTPLSMENITEGRHYVRLERDGFRPWGKVMSVTSRSETAETAPLRATAPYEEYDALADAAIKHVVGPNAEGGRVRQATETAEKLCSALNADTVMLAQVRLDGERVQINANQYDLASHRMLKAATHVFTYGSTLDSYEHEVAVMLHTSFGAEGLAQADGRALPQDASIGASRVARRDEDLEALPHAGESGTCWGGTSCRAVKYAVTGTTFGLGLASLGVATAEWIFAARTHTQWTKLKQVDASQLDVRAHGRNQALIGDILGAAGVALVVAGTVSFFVWEPGPSIEDVIDNRRNEKVRQDKKAREDNKAGGEKKAPATSAYTKPNQSLRVAALPVDGGGMLHAVWAF